MKVKSDDIVRESFLVPCAVYFHSFITGLFPTILSSHRTNGEAWQGKKFEGPRGVSGLPYTNPRATPRWEPMLVH